jgi:heme oxygenase (biliverdin-IX-beta and delta-forming)
MVPRSQDQDVPAVRSLRQLLEAERHGVLATLSVMQAGWPFASATPFALDAEGRPLFLLSELAEHTRNLRADARASLIVQDSGALDDPQAGARVTILGTVGPSSGEGATARYVERHPQARYYLPLGDFHVWVLEPKQARFISGFGDMGWLEGEPLWAALRAG